MKQTPDDAGCLAKETYEEVIQNFLLGKGSVSNN
jgi:hypothetical protein